MAPRGRTGVRLRARQMKTSLADRIRRQLEDRRVLRLSPDRLAAEQLAALNRTLDAAMRTAPYRDGYHRVASI